LSDIDTFTDAHPSLDKVQKNFMKNTIITGVIVDVFYDHFLAKNWTHYSTKNFTVV
jgi:acyl carrier protein phosphodiesterase